MANNMQFMSPKRQQEIVDAVKTAADLHTAGTSASDAIAKVASDAGFNANEAKLMVDAFNTSKTLAHMRTSEGVEKAASFELADYDEVAKVLEQTEEKTALATDYEFDTRIPDYRKATQDYTELTEKIAYQVIEDSNGVSVPLDKVSETLDTADDLVMRKACDAVDYWRKEADVKRAEYDSLRFHVSDACSKLAEYFSRAGYLQQWPTFAKEAENLHGDIGKRVVDTLNTEFGLSSLSDRHGCKHAVVTMPDESTVPHKLLKVAVLSAELAADAQAEEQDLRDKHAKAKEKVYGKRKKNKKKSDSSCKKAGLSTLALLNMMRNRDGASAAPPTPEVDLGTDAGLESEYGNARMQMLLRDMMEEDDVLSQHAQEDPATVFQVMNELSTFQPELLKQPIALRSAMRRHLELGQTEPHELNQMKELMEPSRRTALMSPGAVQ